MGRIAPSDFEAAEVFAAVRDSLRALGLRD